jgi:hypothetical protein
MADTRQPQSSCPSCGRDVAATARSCPSCGAGLDPNALSPTRTIHAPGASPASRGGRPTSLDSIDHGRFVPGALILDRYRILGLLGRGGMGEVYRADDLKLGQQVALKFLPPDLAGDPERLARFHNEVRLARQVSHPNVCRVYDIAEVDGQAFLSMEYIDGEDLATLLRRIGRLPKDKALETGRQLCAGLAAAHDRGVLHRDLKPANVMIDGRGRARITDFGLAGEAEAGDGSESRSGTPPYMAPEQLAGGEATVRSDIYALGLVLYELYTGKRAFRGETLAEIARSREAATPTPPTTLVDGLDPAVERVILRCLETDPKDRPGSALAVAAALPGGDPLAIALAAGETPSPEMVAAAGDTGGLKPKVVLLCLAGFVLGTLAVVWASREVSLQRLAPPPKSTDTLVDRAQDVIRRLGYADPVVGTAWGYGWHRSYLEHLRDSDPSLNRWVRLAKPRPTAVYLWYRQSPHRLEPSNPGAMSNLDDPPPLTPGMVSVMIASNGDLWDFQAVPPQVDDSSSGPSAPDWSVPFSDAGLRIEDFTPVPPRWVPPVFGDTRMAWEGRYPDAPEFLVHVEAASHGGRPVFFHVYWPWNRPLRAQPFEPTPEEKGAGTLILAMGLVTLVWGSIFARRNLRMGRVDRKGAFRLAVSIFAVSLAGSLCQAAHVATPGGEWGVLVRLCGTALFSGLVVWVYFVALEPLVRRRCPDRIISWSRLLSGRMADPMVGGDALIGVVFGVCLVLAAALPILATTWFGRPLNVPDVKELDVLKGTPFWIAMVAGALVGAVTQALVLLFASSFSGPGRGRQWASRVVFGTIATVVYTLVFWSIVGPFAIAPAALEGALLTLILYRFGMVALVASLFSYQMLISFPVGGVFTPGYALAGLFPLIVLAALVVIAARVALAGRSLFELRLLED